MPHENVDTALLNKINRFVEKRGPDALHYLLDCASLPSGKATEMAERHARDHVLANLPVNAILRLDPRNKNPERQRELRLLPPDYDVQIRTVGARG